jgi:hypothetical protein
VATNQALLCRATKFIKNPQDAEDFISYYNIQKLQGRKASFYKIYVDFARNKWGRKNNKTLHPLMLPFLEEIYLKKELEPIEGILGRRRLLILRRQERAIFLLYEAWGLTFKEIGFLFNYTEAWAFNIHKNVMNKFGG